MVTVPVKIAVIGLGQIGGSLVLALHKNHRPYHITGIDTSRKRLKLLAPQLDHASTKWEDASQSDLTVLCMHFQQILEFIDEAPRGQLLMDVCSGKNILMQEANRRKLPFVGGHPMAGNERAGEKGWDAELFTRAPFFLCRGDAVKRSQFLFARKLVRDLGAIPIEIEAAKHDRFIAATSHFPALLSKLFVEMSADAPQVFRGPGYRSMTRLSRTDASLLETFLHSNHKNILKRAEKMRDLLDDWILTTKTQSS